MPVINLRQCVAINYPRARRRFRAWLRIFAALAGQTVLGPRTTVLVAALSACGVLIAAYGWSFYFLTVPALVGLTIGFLTRKKLIALILCALPIIFSAYFYWRLPRPLDNDISTFVYRRGVIFTGQVIGTPDQTGTGKTRLTLACDQLIFPGKQKLSGMVLVTTNATTVVSAKDRLMIKAYLRKPDEAGYPWQFNYASYLRRRGIFCLAYAQSISKLAQSPDAITNTIVDIITSTINSMRSRMISAHRTAIGPVDGDILTSVVLGNQAVTLPTEVINNFRAVGLTHILAASGFNLTIVIGVTCWLTNFLTRSLFISNSLSFLAMLVFVALAGPCPSVIRAALMCAILLLGRSQLRTVYTPACLAIALLITLLIDPNAISDVGLQLSYAATICIVFGTKPLTQLLSSIKSPKFLSEALGVVLMAEIGVLPIQLTYFWQLGLLFLPANLLVAPLVEIITVIGFASSAVAIIDVYHWLNPVVFLLDKVTSLPLALMLSIVNNMASYKQAILQIGPPVAISLIAYYAFLSLLLLSLKAERYRLIALTFFLLSLAGIFIRPALPPLTVACFDNCVVVIDNLHHAIVVGDSEDKTKDKLLSYLSAHVDANDTNFSQTTNGGITIVTARQSRQTIMIVNQCAQLSNLNTSEMSDCPIAVIQKAPQTTFENMLICNRLRRLKTQFVIIADKPGKSHLSLRYLAGRLADPLTNHGQDRTDVHILKLERHKPILLALNSDNKVQLQEDQIPTDHDKFRKPETNSRSTEVP